MKKYICVLSKLYHFEDILDQDKEK